MSELRSDSSEEAMIAVLAAKIRASSLNRAANAKEPYDGTIEMVPVAYAMFEVLADACIATGHKEEDWWDFLRCALDECISKSEAKARI